MDEKFTLPIKNVAPFATTGRIILLQCADDNPSWDQRTWSIEVIHEDDENWYGYHRHTPHTPNSMQFPKYAWKQVLSEVEKSRST